MNPNVVRSIALVTLLLSSVLLYNQTSFSVPNCSNSNQGLPKFDSPGIYEINSGIHPITSPISICASNVTIVCDPGAVIQVTKQIDGGIIQIPINGITNPSVQRCVLDGNNLAMMGVWIPKTTPGWLLRDVEIKNIRGISGLQTVQNPAGVLTQGQWNGLAYNVNVHDISSPNYNGGNGACFWITGNLGISQSENTQIINSKCSNTKNVMTGELISGFKADVNTRGLTFSGDTATNLSGDCFEVLSGGGSLLAVIMSVFSPNISNGHTITNSQASNCRMGINLNSNNGGVINGTIITKNQISNVTVGIGENGGGVDYTVISGNTVSQASSPLVRAQGCCSHDVNSGNTGF